MWKRFLAWKMARVRSWSWGVKDASGKGPYHLTITPHLCASVPWFGNERQRLRIGTKHGVQIISWRSNNRWVTDKQLIGRSKVKGA